MCTFNTCQHVCLLNVVVCKKCHDSALFFFCYCNHLPNNVGESWNKLRHLVMSLGIFELLSSQVPPTFQLVGTFQWLTLYVIKRNIHTRSLLVWIQQFYFYCVGMSISARLNRSFPCHLLANYRNIISACLPESAISLNVFHVITELNLFFEKFLKPFLWPLGYNNGVS